ncbi:MAG: carboxysome shell carbonic anhydrase [Rhodocyclales bacterium]|nr:carboxysome shell carbonic anhydrase [Rhodocyclales bacterium]
MQDIHSLPIAQRIDWLFDLARRHGESFRSPEAWLARERYLAEHPTAIGVLKCMDGRINIPGATNTPAGIPTPFRNLGGMFDLGWPHLGEVLAQQVQQTIRAGRRMLFLITYHWSRGEPKRGCAGFKCDTQAAIAHTQQIRQQMEYIFGTGHGSVYPLVCGFETDEEALILHGSDGQILDLAQLDGSAATTLEPRLAALLPDMPGQMRHDLLPLLRGNLAHIAEIRAQAARQQRTLDIEHREWVICIGRGFDFLHTPNLALIIGPYSPALADPLRKAGSIIQNNMKAGRIPADGCLLLASVPYEEIGVDRARAELKSRFLAHFARQVISEAHPQLARCMTVHTAVLDWRARQLERIAG